MTYSLEDRAAVAATHRGTDQQRLALGDLVAGTGDPRGRRADLLQGVHEGGGPVGDVVDLVGVPGRPGQRNGDGATDDEDRRVLREKADSGDDRGAGPRRGALGGLDVRVA